MRETDTNKIADGIRTFVKTADWKNGEVREFYFTGYEKAEKLSKAMTVYIQYYIYLLPIVGKNFEDEVTLGVFPNQAVGIKGIQNYEKIRITKIVEPLEGNYDKENYEIEATGILLAENDRPQVLDYPEVKISQRPAPQTAKKATVAVETDEINIDDIPF